MDIWIVNFLTTKFGCRTAATDLAI